MKIEILAFVLALFGCASSQVANLNQVESDEIGAVLIQETDCLVGAINYYRNQNKEWPIQLSDITSSYYAIDCQEYVVTLGKCTFSVLGDTLKAQFELYSLNEMDSVKRIQGTHEIIYLDGLKSEHAITGAYAFLSSGEIRRIQNQYWVTLREISN